jgi:peptide/nickel transport system permease protein
VSFGAATVATLIALIVGIGGGYVGGLGGEVLSMLSNCFLVIPALPLVIVLAGYLPSKGGIALILVLALTGWAWGARILRAQTLSLRRRDFVLAARVAGERGWRILFWEILPHVMPIVASGFVFTVIFAIVTQSSLAFLGLGDVSTWSWGTMLYWAQNNDGLQSGAWWWFVPPGMCIGLVGMALALINFGIDDFVNPRLRVVDLRQLRRAGRDRAVVSGPGRVSRTAGWHPAGDNGARDSRGGAGR